MNSSFDADGLAILIEAMLEGDTSDAELNRVHRILAEQREACRYYARYMVMRAELIQDAGSIGTPYGDNAAAGGDIEDPFSDFPETATLPSVPEDNESTLVPGPLRSPRQAAPEPVAGSAASRMRSSRAPSHVRAGINRPALVLPRP